MQTEYKSLWCSPALPSPFHITVIIIIIMMEEINKDQHVRTEELCDLLEIVVAVMGVTGSGKSTFIRTASGLVDEVEVGTGLEACEASLSLLVAGLTKCHLRHCYCP